MKEVAGIRELSLDEVEAVVGGQYCQEICTGWMTYMSCDSVVGHMQCVERQRQICHSYCT